MHENDLLSYNKVLDSLVSSDILEHKQWFKTKNKLWYALGLYNQLPYKRHIRHALFTIPELEELEKMISEFINKACTVGNDELFQQMQKETTDMISFHLLKSNAENLGISNFFSVVANEKYLDFDSIRIERCFEL